MQIESPVREALIHLKFEGLVSFESNRGSIVSSLSTDEIEEIYTMRIVFEEMVLKKAIPNIVVEKQNQCGEHFKTYRC